MLSQLTRYASQMDLPIYRADLDIRTTFDMRGKIGLDDTPSTAEQLWYEFQIDSPAAPEQIQELVRAIDRGCHTTNSLRNPVPIVARVRLNGEELLIDL